MTRFTDTRAFEPTPV